MTGESNAISDILLHSQLPLSLDGLTFGTPSWHPVG